MLLDEHLPIGLAGDLRSHAVDTVAGRGWSGIKNGELLRRMAGQYDVLLTMDRSIELRHRVSALPFGIVVVRARSNRLQHLRPLVPLMLAAISSIASRPDKAGGTGDASPYRAVAADDFGVTVSSATSSASPPCLRAGFRC